MNMPFVMCVTQHVITVCNRRSGTGDVGVDGGQIGKQIKFAKKCEKSQRPHDEIINIDENNAIYTSENRKRK